MSVQSTIGNVQKFTGEFKNSSVQNIGNNADILTGLRVQVYKMGPSKNYQPVLELTQQKENETEQYGNTGCGVFKREDTELERFLPKNQYTQRKLLNFEFWINGELSKSAKI